MVDGARDYPFKPLGAAALYFGVLGFNLFMTFWIGDLQLALVDCFIILPLLALLALTLWRGAQR